MDIIGSNTSSSKKFIEQVNPNYAVIMVGKNNRYGLPKENIIKRLENIGAKIYRTDQLGTIEMVSNGKEISVGTENW